MVKAKLIPANKCPVVQDMASKWSRVLLNDTKQLAKKQSQNATSGYSRRLFAKMKRTSTPARPRSKPNFYHKYVPQSKRSTPVATKTPMENIGSEWKQENDVWNMFQHAIQQSLHARHQLNLPNKDFGVRSGCDKIRLIQNREELNEQVLVSSNGMRSHVRDFVNPNECTENMVFKVRYRLVPVIEGITVVNNSMETSYQFADDAVDINNNNNDDNSDTTLESTSTDGSMDSTSTTCSMDSEESECDCSDCQIAFACTTGTPISSSDSYHDATEDRTMTNTTCSTWEYSDFQSDISPEAASTFISEEKENIPFFAAPRKVEPHSVTFFDSPMPSFAKRLHVMSERQPEYHHVLELCAQLRSQLCDARNILDNIEAHCSRLMKQRTDESDSTLSGIGFLSFCDSMTL